MSDHGTRVLPSSTYVEALKPEGATFQLLEHDTRRRKCDAGAIYGLLASPEVSRIASTADSSIFASALAYVAW